jgi:hypothetical protein
MVPPMRRLIQNSNDYYNKWVSQHIMIRHTKASLGTQPSAAKYSQYQLIYDSYIARQLILLIVSQKFFQGIYCSFHS